MENREDLNSILPLLPLILRSSSLCWPSKALESLKALSRGPQYSEVDSGAILFDAIVDLRDSIGLSKERLPLHAADGYALFFDDVGWTVLVRSTPMCMWKKSMSISTSRIVGPTTDEAPSKNRTHLKAPSI